MAFKFAWPFSRIVDKHAKQFIYIDGFIVVVEWTIGFTALGNEGYV